MASYSLLDQLIEHTLLDCDTLDVEAAYLAWLASLGNVTKWLGPAIQSRCLFENCTSNQAIAYLELARPGRHYELIRNAIITTKRRLSALSNVTPEELAVELMMVQLVLPFASQVKKHLMVQTNTKWSYSEEKTVRNAERLVSHFKYLSPDFDTSRICIKIPSTWEGLQACRELERKGIKTLATTMFCMEQAVLAGDAGCTYIAPYIHELKDHFEPGREYKVDPWEDENEDRRQPFDFAIEASRYFLTQNQKTRLVVASHTCIEDVLAFDRALSPGSTITVAPALLKELADKEARTIDWEQDPVLGRALKQSSSSEFTIPLEEVETIVHDEAAWKAAFRQAKGGRYRKESYREGKFEEKLSQAIRIFDGFQDKLEDLAREWMAKVEE